MQDDTRERLERADDVVNVGIEMADPIVATVESESGNEYTVVPNALYCSCPDKEHRDTTICKHLGSLLPERGPETGVRILTELRQGIETELDGVSDQVMETHRRLCRSVADGRRSSDVVVLARGDDDRLDQLEWREDDLRHLLELAEGETRVAHDEHGPSRFEQSGEYDREYGSATDYIGEIARSATESGP